VDKTNFIGYRKRLGKTQKEIAELLGNSIKAVHSYEQDWRSIPPHVERQVYFLLSRHREGNTPVKNCWTVRHCPKERKHHCPAYEFRAGTLCWLINGTICQGEVHKDWKEKMAICRKCEVLASFLTPPSSTTPR